MNIKKSLFFLLAFIALGTTSCNKEPSYVAFLYDSYFASNGGDGKETKVDVKGSLMNGDMKNPNIAAKLIGSTLYIYYFETIENCMTLISAENGDVVFSRRMAKQYPTMVRVYLDNEAPGNYKLYITDGKKEAEGAFQLKVKS